MWRFLLPSFFVTLMVFGEAGPSHALPLLPSSATDPALSPPVPGVAGQGDARYAADLRRQANDLQDLVTQVEQQLAHRDPQRRCAAARQRTAQRTSRSDRAARAAAET